MRVKIQKWNVPAFYLSSMTTEQDAKTFNNILDDNSSKGSNYGEYWNFDINIYLNKYLSYFDSNLCRKCLGSWLSDKYI